MSEVLRDAEQAVLSACLLDSRALTEISDALTPDSFSDSRHGEVYRAMRTLQSTGTDIDPISLSAELARSDRLKFVGGKDYISELLDMVPTAANVSYHAAIVRRESHRRRLLSTLREATEKAGRSDADVVSLAASVQQDLLPMSVARDGKGYRFMGDVIAEALAEIEDRQKRARAGESFGLLTGYPEIDKVTNGFRPGEFVLFGGGPKCGKTALTLSIALHSVLKGKGAGFVSAEMTAGQLAERCINATALVRTANTSSGWLSTEDWQRMAQAGADIVRRRNFYVDDEAFPNLGDVIARALHLKAQHPEIPLIVVDYLQLVTSRLQGKRGDEEIKDVTKGLKALAKKAGVTVIAPVQTNYKEVDARATPKPTLRDLQGSSGPAQDGDFVFLIHRPGLTNPDPMCASVLEVELAASRRTERFTTQLGWNGSYMRVESDKADLFYRFGNQPTSRSAA